MKLGKGFGIMVEYCLKMTEFIGIIVLLITCFSLLNNNISSDMFYVYGFGSAFLYILPTIIVRIIEK